MDAASPVDTDTDQNNARLVHSQTDGIWGAIACVPAAPLACFGEAVGRCFHRVKRVQSINLINKYMLRNGVKYINITVHFCFNPTGQNKSILTKTIKAVYVINMRNPEKYIYSQR